MPANPTVIDPNRDPKTGRFAPRSARWGITTVGLPNGRVGYQLGGRGVIFADRDSAKRRALASRPAIVHTGPIMRLVGRVIPKPDAPIKATRPARAFGEGVLNDYDSAWLDRRDARRRYGAVVEARGERSPEASAAWRAFREAERRFDAAWRAAKVRESGARGGSWDAYRGGCYTGD